MFRPRVTLCCWLGQCICHALGSAYPRWRPCHLCIWLALVSYIFAQVTMPFMYFCRLKESFVLQAMLVYVVLSLKTTMWRWLGSCFISNVFGISIHLTTSRNLSRVGYASIVYDRKYISTKYLMPHGLKVKPYLSCLTVASSIYKYNANQYTNTHQITHGMNTVHEYYTYYMLRNVLVMLWCYDCEIMM